MGLSKVLSTLLGVISIVTLIITLVTKSHDPLSIRPQSLNLKAPGEGSEAVQCLRYCTAA